MLASSVVLGGLVGLLFRGNWRNLRELRIAWWPLLFVALTVRVVGVLTGLPVWAHAFAIVLTAAVAALNWRIPGALLVAIGSALNAVVIVANAGMPFDVAAAATVGARPVLNDALHHGIGPETRLAWLADVVPVGVFRNVYSAGDLIIAAGGFWIPFALLRRR